MSREGGGVQGVKQHLFSKCSPSTHLFLFRECGLPRSVEVEARPLDEDGKNLLRSAIELYCVAPKKVLACQEYRLDALAQERDQSVQRSLSSEERQ